MNSVMVCGLSCVARRSSVADNALVAPSARLYGPVVIGPCVVIEPGVIIGHPSPAEQAQLKLHLQASSFVDGNAYEEVVDAFVQATTIIEEGCVVRSGTVVYSGTYVDQRADLAHSCLIRENCRIGRDTQIVSGTQVMASVHIGHGCRIAGTLCNRTWVGNCASMLGHAMHKYKVGVPGQIEPSPRIGHGVIVGRESAIVGDVEIGDFSIVGAGAVVTKSVPAYTVWAGNPAVQIGIRNLDECQELVRKVASYED